MELCKQNVNQDDIQLIAEAMQGSLYTCLMSDIIAPEKTLYVMNVNPCHSFYNLMNEWFL